MSWFKRMNEWLNLGPDQSIFASMGEGEAPASPQPTVCGRPSTPARAYAVAMGAPLTDSERLGYDAVSLPNHYKAFPLEPIRFCQENGLSFLQSSIIKYVVRFNLKNGVEDLKKAARCLDMMIAFEEGDPDWWKLPGERATRRTYII